MSSCIHTRDTRPSSNRTAQDVTKCVLTSLGEIRKHGGVVAPELGNSAGERNVACPGTSKNLRGKRIKKEVTHAEALLHDDASEQRKIIFDSSIDVKKEQALMKNEGKSSKF